MKKYLVGALVGGIILFIWQFLSWTVLPLHDPTYRVAPASDSIMATLNKHLPAEDAMYMLPRVKPGASMEEAEAFMKTTEGKPWALIVYHPTMDGDMTRALTRCLLTDIVILLLVISIVAKPNNNRFGKTLFTCISIGLIIFLTTSYTSRIWYETPLEILNADLVDATVGWGLIGVWLGWWLKRF